MRRSTADPSISEQPESKTGIPRNRLSERSQADPSPPIETIPKRLFIREQMSVCFFGAERQRIAEPKISKTRTTRKIFTREIFLLLARVLFFSRTIFFRSAIMLFHVPQPLGKQFLLPVEKGFDSRGRGAYRFPYII